MVVELPMKPCWTLEICACRLQFHLSVVELQSSNRHNIINLGNNLVAHFSCRPITQVERFIFACSVYIFCWIGREGVLYRFLLPALFLFHLLRYYLFFLQVLVFKVDSREACFLECVTR